MFGRLGLVFGQIAAVWLATLVPAAAADHLRLAVQKTGTFAWELAIIKEHGLDKKADLDLEITQLASTEAEKIAIQGNSADLILSDWLWVSRERSLGSKLTFYPYSSSLGAVVVPAQAPFKDLADLKGKKLAVAGGPLDKSWLLLQAFAKRSNLDLKRQTEVLYGAPALLAAKTVQGEVDANLNFWNFCVDLESRGFRRLIGMETVEKELGAKAPVAMVGYVFSEDFAAKHPKVIERFLDIAREAKVILWQNRMKIGSGSDLRSGLSPRPNSRSTGQRYLDGIPHRPVAEEAADAKAALPYPRRDRRPRPRRPRLRTRRGNLLQTPNGKLTARAETGRLSFCFSCCGSRLRFLPVRASCRNR